MTTHELVVQMRGEGIDDTQRDLESVSDSFDDTADSVGDSASEMEGFSQQWRGAMGAVIAGLAVAAAGLLSQVPVIGELFSGLLAILEAVSFHIDQVLRPVLQPLTETLFEWSASIFEAEGAWGTLVGVLGAGLILLTGIVAIAKLLGAAFGVLVGAKTVLIAVGALLVKAITVLVAVLASPLVIIGLVIAAVLLLAWYFREELADAFWTAVGAVRDVISWFGDLLGRIKDFGVDAYDSVREFVGNAVGAIVDFTEDVVSKISNLVSDVTDFFTGLASDALDWGRDLISTFIDGINNRAAQLARAFRDVASQAADAFKNRFNAIIPSSVSIPSVTISIPDVLGGGSQTVGGGSLSLPQLDTGGMIHGDGIAMLHEGEMVLSESEVDRNASLGGSRSGGTNLRDDFERALERTDRTDDVVGELDRIRRAVKALADEFDVDIHVDTETGRHDPF